ncbi:hypothetical protein JTB14_010532 [Gonioctena quinquepunctata]|nr:hypothetical protein JTB14_010532 [Gonioctena quinquepunctata]
MNGGNRNLARGFEERRGNRSRGTRRQMEKKCGIMRAQIPQIDLEEIPYIVTLVVNGQQCDCLVDTGAVVTLVRRRIIPVGDIDTERRTEVRLIIAGKKWNLRLMYVKTKLQGRDFLVKNRVLLKYGPEPVMVLWGQTIYFHSRRGIEKDIGGVETTSTKYYWSSIREVLPRRVFQGEKVQRKSPEKEEKKRETEKGWAKWKKLFKKRTENGGTPLEKEEIGIQIEMVMKKEEKRTEELEEGGFQMIIGSGRTPLVTNEIGTQTEKWVENEKEPIEEMDKENGKRSCVEMEIQVIEDEEIKKEIKEEIDKFEGIDSDAKFQELSEYSLRLILEMDDLNLLRGGDLYNKKIKMLKEVLQVSDLLEKKAMENEFKDVKARIVNFQNKFDGQMKLEDFEKCEEVMRKSDIGLNKNDEGSDLRKKNLESMAVIEAIRKRLKSIDILDPSKADNKISNETQGVKRSMDIKIFAVIEAIRKRLKILVLLWPSRAGYRKL